MFLSRRDGTTLTQGWSIAQVTWALWGWAHKSTNPPDSFSNGLIFDDLSKSKGLADGAQNWRTKTGMGTGRVDEDIKFQDSGMACVVQGFAGLLKDRKIGDWVVSQMAKRGLVLKWKALKKGRVKMALQLRWWWSLNDFEGIELLQKTLNKKN